MNSPIANNNNNNNNNPLSLRRGALMRRQLHKTDRMTSFRLPKETTSQLLHFISDFEPAVESVPQEQEQQPFQSLNRRKRALQRTKQRMTSFRLPKDQTLLLLQLQDIFLETTDQETPELAVISPPTNTIAAATATITTCTTTATTTATTAINNKKFRRCLALQQLKQTKTRMTSFRLPKDQTKPLLQKLPWREMMDTSDTSSNSTESSTRMPPQLVRQSSFSARTA